MRFVYAYARALRPILNWSRIEIKEICALCKAKNYMLEVIWVPSLENAADPLSRGFDACPERNKMTWDILHGGTPRTARKGRPLTLEDDEDLPDDYEGDLIKECLEEAGDEEERILIRSAREILISPIVKVYLCSVFFH